MIKYAIINDKYDTLGDIEVDKTIESNKINSLLDVMDVENSVIIVPTIKVLGDALDVITHTMNRIYDSKVTFQAIQENLNSNNVKAFKQFMNNLNIINDITTEKQDEILQAKRIGGTKRGKRVAFEFPKDFEQWYKDVNNGLATKTDMAKHYDVSRQSVYDWFARYENQKQKG